jgi:hypothetical protein
LVSTSCSWIIPDVGLGKGEDEMNATNIGVSWTCLVGIASALEACGAKDGLIWGNRGHGLNCGNRACQSENNDICHDPPGRKWPAAAGIYVDGGRDTRVERQLCLGF